MFQVKRRAKRVTAAPLPLAQHSAKCGPSVTQESLNRLLEIIRTIGNVPIALLERLPTATIKNHATYVLTTRFKIQRGDRLVSIAQ